MSSATSDSSISDPRELGRSLNSLVRLSDRLNSIIELDLLLDALVEQVVEITGAESGCAGLRVASRMSCSDFVCQPGEGWAGRVLVSGTYYFTNDALHDNVIAPEIRARFDVKSGMCIPIVDRAKQVIAFFEVYNKKSGAGFSEVDLSNSLAAAKIASLAIQNGLTYRKLNAVAAFGRSLALAGELEQVLETVGHHVEINFHLGAVIFLPAGQSLVKRFQTQDFSTNPKEMEAVTWCYEHGQEAGGERFGVRDARTHYLPLAVGGHVIGVLGLGSIDGAWLSEQQPEQNSAMLSAFIAQSALAIERGLLEQRLRRVRFLDESDRLQNALLAAVSHEVRAPLAAIIAAVSGMLNSMEPLEPLHQRKLLRAAEHEAKRLHRLMNNLLNVTRLQAGASRAKLEPCDLLDIAGAALEELGTATAERDLSVEIAEDLPLIPMNFELITQVIVNLLSNAVKFSSADQPIRFSGQIIDGELEVAIADRGRGVPDEDLGHVFEKFRRLAESRSVDGLGLGLSICKEFVEAHRGRIHLESNPGGGTIAKFVLPLQRTA